VFHPGVTLTQTAFRILTEHTPQPTPEPTAALTAAAAPTAGAAADGPVAGGQAPPPRTLVIEHTYAEGTCLHGTRRSDDLYATLRSLGWLFRRSVGDFRLQASQDRPANRGAIARTVEALRTAGFAVEVRIDTTPRAVQQAEDERAVRADHRADRLTARAERLAAEAAGREDAANRVLEHIPLGQPLLTDHHSYRADRRRRDRAHANMARAVELERAAGQTAAAAATAAAHMTHRHNPETVANRIRTLTAELNRYQREHTALAAEHTALAAAAALATDAAVTGGARARRAGELAEHLEHTRAQLTYWQQVRAEQITAGEATNYSRADISRGDLIQYHGGWCVVVRANAKSVSVPAPLAGGTATHTVRYEHLRDHVTPDSARWNAVAVEAVLRARMMANRGELAHPDWKNVEASVGEQLAARSGPAHTQGR
jgi:hypothetical protein